MPKGPNGSPLSKKDQRAAHRDADSSTPASVLTKESTQSGSKKLTQHFQRFDNGGRDRLNSRPQGKVSETNNARPGGKTDRGGRGGRRGR